ncbi:MAG: glycoside hydrolase family 20 zincin-like fold domain-containing protein [Blastocatellia bacterium]
MKTVIALTTLWLFLLPSGGAAQAELNLSRAVIVAPSNLTGPENKAVQMLIEEVERRTQIRCERKAAAAGVPTISISRAAKSPNLPREGYRIQTGGASVTIIGNDARGVLFGVGHLLRWLRHRLRLRPSRLDPGCGPRTWANSGNTTSSTNSPRSFRPPACVTGGTSKVTKWT